jgi:molybdopterin-guanine dinucleotide biosynthesis protein B
MNGNIPVLGFAAWSGTGKTTLLRQLIPRLAERGLRTGVIKHAHHDFDIDIPGKDSYELRKAGAPQVLVASARRQALITETPGGNDPDLDALVARLDHDTLDLVLVEGFRHVAFPRMELHRHATGHPPLYPDDASIIAVACDHPLDDCPLPVLDLNVPAAIGEFILEWLKNVTSPSGTPTGK